MADEYYEISPKVNDIDFYIGESKAESIVQISSQVEASAGRIANASSSISIESSFSSAFLKEVISASAEAQIELVMETTPLEVLNVLTVVHVQSDLTASTQKITLASASVDISSSAEVLCQRVTNFISDAHISTVVDSSARKTTGAKAVASIQVSTDFNTKFIALVRAVMAVNVSPIFKQPIRLSPSYIDDTSIRTLFTLDGKPLTNHNRKFESSISPLFIENKNWNNRSNRYYKRATSSGRRTFSLSWTMLPNSLEDTVDQRHGRDFLNSIAEDPDSHVLKVLNQDENGLTAYTETSYTVFVRSYSETLVRRYIDQGVYLYDCNISLEEV